MSVDSSKTAAKKMMSKPHGSVENRRAKIQALIGFPVWVALSFIGAQYVVVGIIALLKNLGIIPPIDITSSVVNAVFAASIYVTTLAIVMGLPYAVYRWPTTRKLLGLTRSLSWLDILMSLAGAVAYLLLSGLLLTLALNFLPNVDLNETQNIGFQSITNSTQYLLAFSTLVIVAPIAEEVLFRGYLYGNLRRHTPFWLSVVVTSLLFGIAHMQWNVGIDTFALSIVLCFLRETTGSIWAGILLHMLKNGVAFYFLFINPTLFTTLGG